MRCIYITKILCFLSVFCWLQPSHAMTASLGYQGIGADKGINLQVAQPDLFAPGFGFFVEISGNETAGVGKGQSSHVHENYLLWGIRNINPLLVSH